MDVQEAESHIGSPYRTVTQDVIVYLIANVDRIVKKQDKSEIDITKDLDLYERAISTLNVIKNRIWKKGKWPLVTEVELIMTGPWILKPYQYHNSRENAPRQKQSKQRTDLLVVRRSRSGYDEIQGGYVVTKAFHENSHIKQHGKSTYYTRWNH